MNISDKLTQYAPAVLRIGIALVFLWFGFSQVTNAGMWTRLIPEWATSLSGMSAVTIVHFNGAFEIVFGIALLTGFFTRVVALLLALHMFHIAITMGYSAIGVRDFGLAIATATIFLFGRHAFSIDDCLERRKQS